ncbi:MAG: hypothetical protein GWP15_00295 [Nitrospirae bacterium]|nr:hypothetical protein [Nitrospirota bacterium]
MKNKLIIIAMMLILSLSVVFSQVIEMGKSSVLDASTDIDAELQSDTAASVEAVDLNEDEDDDDNDDLEDEDDDDNDDLEDEDDDDNDDLEDEDDDDNDEVRDPAEHAADKIESAEEKIAEAEEKIAEKEEEGKDVSRALESLEKAKTLLAEAPTALDEGDYETALNLAKEAKHTAMWAKGKDIKSASEESKFGRELGECIKEANEEDDDEDEKDFSQCFKQFSDDLQDHVTDILEEKNINIDRKILKALERFREKAGERLGSLLSSLEDFNFSGIDADEVAEELEGLSGEELEEKIKDIKDESTKDKFEKGIVPFKDTDDQDWFYYFVDRMDEEECISGFTDKEGNPLGEFRPGNDVLFGEGLKFVMQCVLDEDPEAAESGDHWAKGYAKKALKELSDSLSDDIKDRIENSLEDKEEFKKGLTRGELVQMVMDLLGIEVPTATGAPFSDVSLDNANVDAIAYALAKGLVSGDAEDLTFRPDDVPNRAEVAKIILLAKELL